METTCNSRNGLSKIALFFLLALFLIPTKSQAKNRTLSNGFSMSASLGFVNSDFGTPDFIPSDDVNYSKMWGFQIGNRWYFAPTETWGIGLMVNWFDISYVGSKVDDFTLLTVDVSALELGPVFTYTLTEAMAFDAYYNLRPTILATADTDMNAFGGFGITHAFGIAYRWKVLSVGIESLMGKVSPSQYSFDDEDVEEEFDGLSDSEKMLNNKRFQIVLGVKF